MSSFQSLSIHLLKERGYAVGPDPPQPESKKPFNHGPITSFARQSRLGYTDLSSSEKVEATFMESVQYLGKVGDKRNSLETGSCGFSFRLMACTTVLQKLLILLGIWDAN